MNDLENYKTILEQYFGSGTATFNTAGGVTNNVVGALNHTGFAPFRSAFFSRLKRLAARYANADSNRKHLVVTLNEVASEKNWEGAYAELVAFDFLNSDVDWLLTPISLSKTVLASETLASGLGNQNANFDGFYDDFGICFDVKILSDKSRDILDGIIAEAKTKLGISGVVISPEYPLDLDFELFQQNRNILLNELVSSVNVVAKTTLVNSTVLCELRFKLMWQGGVLATISSYDPYLHAANHHTLLFKHAKKFSTVTPSLIVFVIFPWFSEKVTTQTDSSEIFYRSLCRRFFCQYAKDTRPANSIMKSFRGSENISQVTEKLSGVLILQDLSITTKDPQTQNVLPFAYLNPNAAKKVSGHFREHLSSLGFITDDFANDNY